MTEYIFRTVNVDNVSYSVLNDDELVKTRIGMVTFRKNDTDKDLWQKMKNPRVKSFAAYHVWADGLTLINPKRFYLSKKTALKEIVKNKEDKMLVQTYKFVRTKYGWTTTWIPEKTIEVFYFRPGRCYFGVPNTHFVMRSNHPYHVNKDGTIGRRLD